MAKKHVITIVFGSKDKTIRKNISDLQLRTISLGRNLEGGKAFLFLVGEETEAEYDITDLQITEDFIVPEQLPTRENLEALIKENHKLNKQLQSSLKKNQDLDDLKVKYGHLLQENKSLRKAFQSDKSNQPSGHSEYKEAIGTLKAANKSFFVENRQLAKRVKSLEALNHKLKIIQERTKGLELENKIARKQLFELEKNRGSLNLYKEKHQILLADNKALVKRNQQLEHVVLAIDNMINKSALLTLPVEVTETTSKE